ncbi:regulatory signaling modulator protein AmpE [Halopseudomonas pelagia]|uniref:regulatory signaling modulator protein AmpE n=1 Tax=Halopseudomonas pelagia TaxID=553151 RepID=UPI0003A93F99|nr:regulatory signaling modulator protein AmpE [Halopseudomonas pelagia]|tara:strand:+ start:204352 stop:205173 length:822 start_codon:yes stop_codon:yes gene_type:complete
MSFLVLLMVGLIVTFTPWRKGFPLDVFGGWVAGVSHKTAARPAWQALVMLVLPLVAAGVLLWLVDGIAYGVFVLLTHTLLLLLCVGRQDPLGSLALQFEQAWQRGDREAASLVAQRDLDIHANGPSELVAAVRTRLVWEVCAGYLVPAFWYLLLGPLGAMAYRLLQQMQTQLEHPLRPLAVSITHALEWLPARLMALSMALVGHFERTIAALAGMMLRWEVSAASLTGLCAEAALAPEATKLDRQAVMQPVHRLLQRSMLVWAVVIAFLSVLA